MISDYIDMDTKEPIRYISESSNASTSGYSTNGGGGAFGNCSPGSSNFASMPSSPAVTTALAQSPGTAALQREFSNLSTTTKQQSKQWIGTTLGPGGSLYATTAVQEMNYNVGNNNQQQQQYPAFLRILEQPVDKFRFRYKSEMHGTHGSLNGANSKRTPKTFPEVELCNFQGEARIRCSIFQTNIESPHSHQLVVRKDESDIYDPHDLEVSPSRGYVAQFQNMGIIHTAKKYIFNELFNKKKDRLCFELGRDELSTKQMQELRQETEREAKDMNLNQVRLCFEAFKVEKGGMWSRIAAPVYSNPINNRKSAQTGELRICRLSIATGSVKGNEDLILLVEKVSKKNIKVRFFELNEDEECVWEAFAKFRESDVHHQYAIVCQTPSYHNKDIEKPVDVFVELVRPSDDERSFPGPTFRYKPHETAISRKRRRTCSSATSSSSGKSLGSFELPKPLQDQTINQQPPQQQHGDYPVGNTLTISEEFNKDAELERLLDDNDFTSFVDANSEELSRLCIRNVSGFSLFDQDLSATSLSGVSRQPLQEQEMLQRDGVSSAQTNTKSKDWQKNLMMAITNIRDTKISHLSRIFKLYDDLYKQRSPHQAQWDSVAKSVESIYSDYAEKHEVGDTLFHELIANDDHKLAMKLAIILKYFKLSHLLNRTNLQGETVLHYACFHDCPQYVRPLLSLGCDPNKQDRNGNTPLHVAIKEQMKQCVQSFLQSAERLDLAIANDDGLSPLHLAIREQHYDLAIKFINHDKSSVLVTNKKEGNTALHMAVLKQNVALVQACLNGQAVGDLMNIRNTGGYTAYDIARNITYSNTKAGAEIFQILLSLSNDVADIMAIKEEDISSNSSAEDEERVSIKSEPAEDEFLLDDDGCTKDGTESWESTSRVDGLQPAKDLAAILTDPEKVNRLAIILKENWRSVATSLKLGHYCVLWISARNLLTYVCNHKDEVSYDRFAAALAEVDPAALAVLEA